MQYKYEVERGLQYIYGVEKGLHYISGRERVEVHISGRESPILVEKAWEQRNKGTIDIKSPFYKKSFRPDLIFTRLWT